MAPKVSDKISQGDMLAKAVQYLEEIKEEFGLDAAEAALSSGEKLIGWWKTATGGVLPKNQKATAEQWRGLLLDDPWREAMLAFISTPTGKKAWTIKETDSLRTHPYAALWLERVYQTEEFFEELFPGDKRNKVEDADLVLISSLAYPRKTEDLKHFFFPKDKSYYEKNPRHMAFASAHPEVYKKYMGQRNTPEC